MKSDCVHCFVVKREVPYEATYKRKGYRKALGNLFFVFESNSVLLSTNRIYLLTEAQTRCRDASLVLISSLGPTSFFIRSFHESTKSEQKSVEGDKNSSPRRPVLQTHSYSGPGIKTCLPARLKLAELRKLCLSINLLKNRPNGIQELPNT